MPPGDRWRLRQVLRPHYAHHKQVRASSKDLVIVARLVLVTNRFVRPSCTRKGGIVVAAFARWRGIRRRSPVLWS